jgi:hypothetical protein
VAKTPTNHRQPWTKPQESQLRREAQGNTPTGVIVLHLKRTESRFRLILDGGSG